MEKLGEYVLFYLPLGFIPLFNRCKIGTSDPCFTRFTS